MFKKLLAIALIFSISGCASMGYLGSYEKTGVYTPGMSQSVVELAKEMKSENTHDITVFIGEGLEGTSINEDGTLIYDDQMWESVGIVSADPDFPRFFGGYFASGYVEEENWKNTYCLVNNLLSIGTLTLWYFTPFPYFCKVVEGHGPDDIENRKRRIVDILKKLTKSAGGEVVVITDLGGSQTVNLTTGVVVGTHNMMSARGVALKKKSTYIEPTSSI